jgi:hypothetical protein
VLQPCQEAPSLFGVALRSRVRGPGFHRRGTGTLRCVPPLFLLSHVLHSPISPHKSPRFQTNNSAALEQACIKLGKVIINYNFGFSLSLSQLLHPRLERGRKRKKKTVCSCRLSHYGAQQHQSGRGGPPSSRDGRHQ